jgi:hypothetical protein
MKTKLSALIATLALAIAVVGITAAPAAAHGCTPGFWKNHTSLYVTNPTVGSFFTGFDASIASLTMSEALELGGGSGIVGAQRILARAAAAAYFNITVTGDYPASLATLATNVNAVLASGDRAAILDVAASIDFFNNVGNPAFC